MPKGLGVKYFMEPKLKRAAIEDIGATEWKELGFRNNWVEQRTTAELHWIVTWVKNKPNVLRDQNVGVACYIS